MMSNMFGEDFHFKETTYKYMGLADRSYSSFREMVRAIGKSRVYGGIHYQASCEEGTRMGEKVTKNVLRKVKFRKHDD